MSGFTPKSGSRWAPQVQFVTEFFPCPPRRDAADTRLSISTRLNFPRGWIQGWLRKWLGAERRQFNQQGDDSAFQTL